LLVNLFKRSDGAEKTLGKANSNTHVPETLNSCSLSNVARALANPSGTKGQRLGVSHSEKMAAKLQNPRLAQITFHTLRHWKGTMEYHRTKDGVHVKQLLGHRNIESTKLYINLEQTLFSENAQKYHIKVAGTVQEAKALIEQGFEYVTEIENLKLFRRRK
jgi:integrase